MNLAFYLKFVYRKNVNNSNLQIAQLEHLRENHMQQIFSTKLIIYKLQLY